MPSGESPDGYRYIGDELDVFALAGNWKKHLQRRIGPFLSGAVLEVGAGLGATTIALQGAGSATSWTCLEPDASLAGRLGNLRPRLPTRVLLGTLNTLEPGEVFDRIIYIDVLEHIEDDRSELLAARDRLKLGGFIVVLAPAHGFLFSPFDKAIGHFRRYDRETLRRLAPTGMKERHSEYLDAAGVVLSLGNRLVLRSGKPTAGQVRFWDRRVVPLARVIDPLLGRMVGKSLLMVWERVG